MSDFSREYISRFSINSVKTFFNHFYFFFFRKSIRTWLGNGRENTQCDEKDRRTKFFPFSLKKIGKEKLWKKNQQNISPFFPYKKQQEHIWQNWKTMFIIQKKEKNWPPFYTTLFKKRNYSSQSKKKFVRISFFFLFPIYLQKNKKDLVSNKIFPFNSQKKTTAPKKKSRFLLQKKIIISHFCFEIRLIIE